MDFGALMFFTDYAISAVDLAKALEERGFESVWAPEHSHIPTSSLGRRRFRVAASCQSGITRRWTRSCR
jgi:alkanesulfonate monooxygenase SsuD/methylene tetrahydromethanopterin reductase-like flavin-dependent oxidoreductase (luciferase family)